MFGAGAVLVPVLQTALALSQQMKNVSVMLVIVLLFFAPVLLYVVGVPHLSTRWTPARRSAYWSSLRQVGLRALIWVFGCGVGVAAVDALRGLP
jgi:hypothetical protein